MSQLQPPRGTHDVFAEDALKQDFIFNKFQEVASLYNYDQISTPIFESIQVFDRTLGEESDIVSKEMYVFEDRGGDRLCLRPEGTAGVVRAFLSNSLQRETPLKLYYFGPMFRYERPQKGRFRQFNQLGVEVLGVENPLVDAEVLILAEQLLKKLNIDKDCFLEINSLGSKDDRQKYRKKLVEYFGKYKSDLSEDSQRRLSTNPLRVLDSKNPADIKISTNAPTLADYLSVESKTNFEKILKLIEQSKLDYRINSKLVRGLDYYNDLVFEFKTTALGAQDAVLSGGRYDGLVESMGGSATSGVGFAAGVERLALLMKASPSRPRPIVMAPLEQAAESVVFKIAEELRNAGQRVEHTYSGNLAKRMKRAGKLNAQWVVIVGENEIKENQVTLKNFDSGQQETLKLPDFLSRFSKD